MQTKIAFCGRFRGIKAGRYVWNCFRCKRWLRNCCELACLAVLATHLLVSPTESESTTLSANAVVKQPVMPAVLEACIVPVNPVTHSMRSLLTRHQVPETNLERLAEAIVSSATKYELDPKLIASIAIIESRGNPFAISGKAAVGIMQIHLPTWGPVANREGINLLKIEDNIDFGTRILRDYIRRFGVWEGVKRYNGFVRGNEESEQSADAYVAKVQQIYKRG
jgi:transglycosylase-like protein with SLT domain